MGRALGYELEYITGIEPSLFLAASEGNESALAKVEAQMTKGTSSQARSNIQRPSMPQDIQKGRRTEIGELNGFIVQKAKEAGFRRRRTKSMVDIVRRASAERSIRGPNCCFDLVTEGSDPQPPANQVMPRSFGPRLM